MDPRNNLDAQSLPTILELSRVMFRLLTQLENAGDPGSRPSSGAGAWHRCPLVAPLIETAWIFGGRSGRGGRLVLGTFLTIEHAIRKRSRTNAIAFAGTNTTRNVDGAGLRHGSDAVFKAHLAKGIGRFARIKTQAGAGTCYCRLAGIMGALRHDPGSRGHLDRRSKQQTDAQRFHHRRDSFHQSLNSAC